MTQSIRYIFAIILLAAYSCFAYSQTPTDKEKEAKPKTYAAGSAWTLNYPLGQHIESTLDTLLYNYQRQFVTALTSDAWASTGQFSGAGINMIYFQRTAQLPFLFDNSIEKFIPTFSKQKFYNVYVPYTQVSYNWGYGSENRTDQLKATFAGNVNRKIGVGAFIDYPYTKGSYASQATKGLAFGFSGYYTGSRYEMQAFYNHFNHLNKENGGITDVRYITDPAELQGGVSTIEPRSIPVNLQSAHSRLIGSQLYMTHSYKVGFWRDITQEEDTVTREEYVPVMKFTYSFDWQQNHHLFIDNDASDVSSFWSNRYFDSTYTRDNQRRTSLTNTFGLQMIEGFQKRIKFGLSAYASYEFNKYTFDVNQPAAAAPRSEDTGLTPLPTDFNGLPNKCLNRFYVGGRIDKRQGSLLRYSVDARFGILGDVAGDIDISGQLQSRFRLAKDTVIITAGASFKNIEPDYLLKHYAGNNFIWNLNLDKTRSIRAEGKLYIPWTRTELRAGVENLQNVIYFGSDCTPQQHSGHIQIVSAAITQPLRAGIWNWDNTLTWQASSDKGVIPLPALTLYSNMYLQFKAFRALTVQVGVDCDYYTRYTGYAYQPATMAFHIQQPGDAVKTGNFIFSDIYLSAKLYKVRLFLMCSHLNQNWFSRDYFSLPGYPLDPRQFRLGLSVDFND